MMCKMALKMVFAVVLVLACLTESWSKSVSSISIGGLNIYTDGQKLQCDTITCPETSERCVISIKTDEKTNNTKIETWKRCLNKNGTIDEEEKKITDNPNPNESLCLYTESSRDGSINTLDSEGAKKVSEAILADIEETIKEIQEDVEDLAFPWI